MVGLHATLPAKVSPLSEVIGKEQKDRLCLL